MALEGQKNRWVFYCVEFDFFVVTVCLFVSENLLVKKHFKAGNAKYFSCKIKGFFNNNPMKNGFSKLVQPWGIKDVFAFSSSSEHSVHFQLCSWGPGPMFQAP